MVDLLPQLDREPDRKADVLRGLAPIDVYLIAIGSLDDLVVQRDQRREAIRGIATRADWNRRTLRQTALRARVAWVITLTWVFTGLVPQITTRSDTPISRGSTPAILPVPMAKPMRATLAQMV